jgi:hypothetical protein
MKLTTPINWRTAFAWLLLGLLLLAPWPTPAQADAADAWWDEAWPYRIPVTVSGSGVAQVSVNFTTAFNTLGLNGALLDVRSIRVVPYNGTSPGSPLPYQESYSTVLDNADAPQIGWSGSGVYWTVNDGSAQADTSRFSQGSGSLKAVVNWIYTSRVYLPVVLK